MASWLSEDNLNAAKGKSREQIFSEFGNELQPIAEIPHEYAHILDADITDNRVYCGMGYMIDHAINHHPEVKIPEYANIQNIIDNPDDVKLDGGKGIRKPSLLFIKNINESAAVVVSFDATDNGKLLLHKSFFNKMKKGRYNNLPSVKQPLMVGNPIISPNVKTPAADRLFALNGNIHNITPAENSVKNSVTPAEDAAYMDAVKTGDMETAGRMVREAAAKAMPNTKVVDEDGNPLVVWRRDNETINTYDFDKTQKTDAGWLGKGFYFYGDKGEAERAYGYGKNLRGFYLDATEPYYIGDQEYEELVNANNKRRSAEFTERLKEESYDSVYYNGDLRQEWVVFEPNHIKLADAVTYDDAGNVIPLSQRFNPANDDIRYSVTENRRKDLLAVHNLSEDSLRKAMALGGFPMPSIAVTKDTVGNSGYGDISLIFSPDTIDPKTDRKNVIYSGDAWTPTFPTIENNVDWKKAEGVGRVLKKLVHDAGLSGIDGFYELDRRDAGLKSYFNTGDPVDRLAYNKSVKAAYLLEKGEKIERKTRTVNYAKTAMGPVAFWMGNDDVKAFAEKFRDVLFDSDGNVSYTHPSKEVLAEMKDWLKSRYAKSEHIAQIAKFSAEYAERDVDEYLKDGMYATYAESLARAFKEMQDAPAEGELDVYAVRDDVEARVKSDDPDFRSWLRGKYEGNAKFSVSENPDAEPADSDLDAISAFYTPDQVTQIATFLKPVVMNYGADAIDIARQWLEMNKVHIARPQDVDYVMN